METITGIVTDSRANRFSKATALVLLLSFAFTITLKAQKEVPFNDGEVVKYDLKFKYGLVMAKAGNAFFKINETYYQGEEAYKATLEMKTSSFFDGIYEMRDTLTSYMSKERLEPLYGYRSVNEGSSHYTEKLEFLAFGQNYSKAHVVRTKASGTIAVDTIHEANNAAYDMTAMFLYIRALDYGAAKAGDTFRIASFMGKSNTNMVIRCRGQHVIEKSSKHKFKTIKFEVDIVSDAFTESKNAIEIWISDDENRIPIKMKAKLKVGAMEIFVSSTKNLKYPFSAEIKLKK